MKSIIGRKIGMTSVFDKTGLMIPVSVVEVLPNVVLLKRTKERDGYEALQIGYEDKKPQRATKSELGIAGKAHTVPHYVYRELKGEEIYGHEVGDSIDCSIFKAGELVDVTGVSKGRGFAGMVKRHNAKIGPKGHGSGYHRQVGSLATNGRCNNRIHPGRPMPGHMGHVTSTVLNQTVVAVMPEKNCILIKGSLPGPNRSIVKIRTAVKPINKPVTYTLIDYSDPETLKALANVAAKGGKQTAKTNVRAQKHGGKGGK